MLHSRTSAPRTPAESAALRSARRAGVRRRMVVGLCITALTLIVCGVVIAVWGPIYGRYGWRVLSIGALWVEAMLQAVMVEGLRPQNPYRYLDHRFSFMDRGPTTIMQNADTSDLWYAVPGLVASALLLLTFAAS